VAKTAIQIALANWDPSTGVAHAWKIILENLINSGANVVKQTTVATAPGGGSVTAAPRCNREDKITIEMPDVNGITHVFRIPTPSTLLSPVLGGDSLDIANLQVLAWVSAMTSHAVTADGVAFAGVTGGGRYIRHKSEKKGGY
jgi:hypothetical protein